MALVNYAVPLHTLLGDCVDTALQAEEVRCIYQFECRIAPETASETLANAARDIICEMRKHGCTRVNPCVRPTSSWLDVNCLFA